MRVVLVGMSHLARYMPGGSPRFELVADGPLTIAQALDLAGISPQLVMAALVDGQRREKSFCLEDGAEVLLVPPLAGG
ncbi:MAG: hypothetical protein AB1492_05850 [Bacillota bacterium]